MKNLMNLTNLKMTTAVAAILTLAVSIAPKAAYAQRRYSGTSINPTSVTINFELNTSATSSTGFDPTGIQNFKPEFQTDSTTPLGYKVPAGVDTVVSLPLHICTTSMSCSIPAIFKPSNTNEVVYYTDPFTANYTGTITSDKMNSKTDMDKDSSNFSSTLNQQFFLHLSSGNSYPSGVFGDYIAYDKKLNEPHTELSPSDGDYFSQSYLGFTISPVSPEPEASVPEPTNIASFCAFGALGAISLLQYKRNFSKHFSNRNFNMSTQARRPPL